MRTVTIESGTTVSYHPDYLDVAAILTFFRTDSSTLSLADAHRIGTALHDQAPMLMADHPLAIPNDQPQDAASVIQHVLEALSQDPDFAAEVAANKSELHKETQTTIQQSTLNPTNPTLVQANRASLTINRSLTEQRVVYSANGTDILAFDRAYLDTATGKKLEMLLAWTSLIWDACSFMGSCFDIWFPKSDAAAMRQVSTVVASDISNWQKFVNGMKKIKDAVTPSAKIQQLISAFSAAKSLLNVAKAILCNLSFWQKLKTVLQFIASIALLFVSAGASLVAKLVKLVAQLAYVIADVVNILQLEAVVATKSAPAPMHSLVAAEA